MVTLNIISFKKMITSKNVVFDVINQEFVHFMVKPYYVFETFYLFRFERFNQLQKCDVMISLSTLDSVCF